MTSPFVWHTQINTVLKIGIDRYCGKKVVLKLAATLVEIALIKLNLRQITL